MGRCIRCHRTLKDPNATIGPVCAGKQPRAEKADEGMLRASFTVDVRDGFVLLEDRGTGRTITNDAEDVIRRLWREGALEPGRRVLYRDTQGIWDEIRIDGMRFAGFRGLGGRTPEEAIEKARAA